MAAVTAVSSPTATRTTSGSITPKRYRALSVVSGVALVLVVLVALALTGALERRTDRLRERTGPVLVATQQLFSSLAEADAAATAVQLSGATEDREQRRFYEQALERSTQQVERVASLIGDDPDAHQALQGIAAKLTQYAGIVESARTQNRAGSSAANATLTSALDLMRTGIAADVASLTTISEQRLDDDYERPVLRLTLTVVVLAASLAALFALQRFMTQRSRRILNAPTLIGTLAVVVLLVWLVLAERGQRHDLHAAADDGYRSIALTSRIQGVAYRAKAEESLALLGTTVGSDAFDSFRASARTLAVAGVTVSDVEQVRDGRSISGNGLLFDAARLADSARERYAAGEMLVRWQRYQDTNATIRTAVARGDRDAARLTATTTGNQAFNGFNLSVESAVQDNTVQFEQSLKSAGHRLRFLRAGGVLLPLAALLLMLWGTQMRIGEYR
ncbi:MAG TPA: hypothetical protein VGQ20_08775 [Acidimicrobiales bacterium]|jgi:CHASE3 domain sensor protein|nr:hypothetical protein [Acidimicrobiales bacterium]